MHARHLDAHPHRKRLYILLLAGSIGFGGLSVAGQEPTGPPPVASPDQRIETPATAATRTVLQAQPVAGPFGEFRISRYPFFGGKKTDSRSTLKFRSPKSVQPSANVPKPPPLAPMPDSKPSVSAGKVAEKPQPKVTAIPKKPEPKVTKKPSNPIRPQRPTNRPSSSSTANRRERVASDGWVARQAINQDSPLRDPRSKVTKLESMTRRPAEPESKRQPTAADTKKKLVFPEVHSSLSKNKVPSAELATPKNGSAASAVDAIPPKAVKAPNRSIVVESMQPVLDGPALNPPKTNATPKSKQSAPRQSAPRQSAPRESAPRESAPRQSATKQSATKQSAPKQSATKQSATKQSAPRQSAPEQSATAKKTIAAAKKPQARTAKALPKQEPSNRQPRLAAPKSEDHQRTTKSKYAGSETQYIGTEPRQTELDYTGRPAEDFAVSSRVLRMKPGIQRVLQQFYDRPEIAEQRSNWGMMHSIMVYGVDTRILSRGKSYSAIGWIAGNNICRGKRLLLHDDSGIKVDNGVGLQGHQGQFLMVLSLADVPPDYPLYAKDTKYTVRDLVKTEMAACKSGQELTFTLIGLSHYLDTEASWVTPDGQRWDFPRLIREELAQPVVGAACGGTHRLMVFGHALRKRRAEGRPITGQWARAEKFTQDFVHYAYQLQNRDGSMSARWFEGRADDGDTDRKIQTTGHIVEWLLTVTPDAELQNPRLVAGVAFLLSAMQRYQGDDKQIGPKGHALRSLAMYYDRIYKSGPAWKKVGIARSGTKLSR